MYTKKFFFYRMDKYYSYIEPSKAPDYYGSVLFPSLDIPVTMTPEDYLARLSKSRYRDECDSYRASKVYNYKTIREKNETVKGRKPYCEICSETTSSIYPDPIPIYHIHSSTLLNRMRKNVTTDGFLACDNCEKSRHSYYYGERLPIILSSSILNNWRAAKKEHSYCGDTLHVDEITIPGATVQTLTHAFEAEYCRRPQPKDVLLVCGLNDILRGHSVGSIMNDIIHLKKVVFSRGSPLSTFAVATLPFPPMLTTLPMDTHKVQRNMSAVLTELTDEFIKFNNSSWQQLPVTYAPKFHTWGLKGSNLADTGASGKLVMHRRGQWREQLPEKMLHLNDAARLRMGRACIAYFNHIYKIQPTQRYPPKIELTQPKTITVGMQTYSSRTKRSKQITNLKTVRIVKKMQENENDSAKSDKFEKLLKLKSCIERAKVLLAKNKMKI